MTLFSGKDHFEISQPQQGPRVHLFSGIQLLTRYRGSPPLELVVVRDYGYDHGWSQSVPRFFGNSGGHAESEERIVQPKVVLLFTIYQLASKVYSCSFMLRFSVPPCAVPDLFPGTMIQETVV